jgi:hypothetical protein
MGTRPGSIGAVTGLAIALVRWEERAPMRTRLRSIGAVRAKGNGGRYITVTRVKGARRRCVRMAKARGAAAGVRSMLRGNARRRQNSMVDGAVVRSVAVPVGGGGEG